MSTDPTRVQSKALSAPDAHQRLLVADRYRLDTVIGRGGMGQVWHGWDEVLERPVAVKVLHEILQNGATTERFALEARTAAQLNHPHVVAVYDFGVDQDRAYLVMELVTGRSLAQELDSAVAMDAPQAAALGAQVAAGLAGAHRHGVVHRDIKPGNLLLDGQGSVRIADFGIARFTQETTTALAPTAAGQVIGTVAYLAPERVLGRPTTSASDLYALGCVLYQLLTGTVPFTTDFPAATLYQHVHTEPVPPHHLDPAVPVALSQYVVRMLAKEPAERPSAEQAENWLRHWILDPARPSPVTRPDATRSPVQNSEPRLRPTLLGPSRTDRPRPRRRRLLVTGTAVATLGAATAGVLALSNPAADTGRRPPARSQPAAASASTPTRARPTTPPASTAPPHRASPAQPATSTAPTPPVTSSSRANTPANPNHGSSQHGKEQNKTKKPRK